MNNEGRPSGFGFLTFKAAAAVAKAVAMDGQELQGRWIKVKEADGTEKNKAPGRFGEQRPRPAGCVPYTLHPAPYTLHSQPSTLSPKAGA